MATNLRSCAKHLRTSRPIVERGSRGLSGDPDIEVDPLVGEAARDSRTREAATVPRTGVVAITAQYDLAAQQLDITAACSAGR